MKRREFIKLAGGAAAAWPLAARAQVTAKRPLIAFLSESGPWSLDRKNGFLRGMHEAGYFEGQNFDLVERYADGNPQRLPVVAQELVRSKPDLILAAASSAALAMKQLTTTIPIVVPTMADPVRLGLVASEARPGGNVTGILVNIDGLPGKQLQFAAELVPEAAKIGFLLNLANPGMAFQRPEIEAAAAALGRQLVTAGVRSPDDLEAAFQSLASERVGCVMVGQDGDFLGAQSRIGALAAAARLPWVSGHDYAAAGAVIGYGVDGRESYHHAAAYVDKILKGAKPSDLPVELPTKVGMIINLKSAKALGIAIPPSIMLLADEVIE